MQDFTKLRVWRAAHGLALQIYAITRSWPGDERFGLTQQIRRAAGSIPSNVAEGAGRFSRNGFARFLAIASGSASEVEYQALLARDLGYLDPEQHQAICHEATGIRRQLARLRSKLITDS